MNRRKRRTACGLVLLGAALMGCGAPPVRAAGGDPELAAARDLVEKSDRYLHHSRLRRGMKGYGLTVLAGMEIVRFDVEIVSVVSRWGPHQDVILARLAGQNLAKSGIIAGMSGSPCFVTDPRDGKAKMIGAVAYGWSSQNVPLCGIQPITQMLVVHRNMSRRAAGGAAADAGASGGSPAPAEFLEAVLTPEKKDFSRIGWPDRTAEPASASRGPRLAPLVTPLMVSGLSGRTLSQVEGLFAAAGMVPVQAGGVPAGLAGAAKDAKFRPGSAISVPLATGDADMSAVGTVTEVIGDSLLAFGHSFRAAGDVEMPIGPAYVHTVVSSKVRSFKLSGTLGITGALTRDEQVGVGGVVGKKVEMVPMTVTVDWKADGRKQVFRYGVCWHRYFTSSLMRTLLYNASWGWRELPEHHTVRYSVDIEYDKLGMYRAANISSGSDIFDVSSDLTRPVSALLNNPWGVKSPRVKRVDVKVTVQSNETTAGILQLELDGPVYRPGETITGAVTVRPFRSDRTTIPVRFTLPGDLPEGDYTLYAGDAAYALGRAQSEMPHRYRARNLRELFGAIKRVVQPQADHLYLRVPLARGGLAIRRQELPDLPESTARILAEARKIDARRFTRAIVRTEKTPYVLSGSASASFRVEARPGETLIRQQRK